MTTYTIKKGFDLRLAGKPEPVLVDAAEPARVCLETAEFPGIKPKVLVKEGDMVVTGQPLFLDKTDRDLVWCSPATGKVARIDFGERRFLLRLVIDNALTTGGKEEFAALPKPAGDREALIKAIKGAGLWPLFRQRPVGKMANSGKTPVAIYVNGMDTAPNAADPVVACKGQKDALQAGIDLLKKLCATVHLTLRAGADAGDLRGLSGATTHEFAGPHPSGLVGTHISRIQPLKPGEVCWSLTAQDVARLGEWAKTGRYPAKVVVAVAGSAAGNRKHFKVRQSGHVSALNGGKAFEGDVRMINGTVLHGEVVGQDGCLGFLNKTLTVIPEGTGKRDLFGWALPQFARPSWHRSVFNWLAPKKEYEVDARLHGGHRPIVNIGAWEGVTPLDIVPSYLVRAIQANDVEEAVKLGLLEVTEEDVALCTFVDPCKIDVGQVIRQGLDMYEREG